MNPEMSVALIAGVVQAIKMTGKVASDYCPLIAVVLGMIVGLSLNLTVVGLYEGVGYGLMASGLYSLIDKTSSIIRSNPTE